MAALTLLFTVGLWFLVGSYAEKIRNASVIGCQEGNTVREALRISYQKDIQNVKASDPNDFPDIPSARFSQLVKERVKDFRHRQASIPDRDCEAEYPQG